MYELMDRNPRPRDLRRFGVANGIVLFLVGALLYWRAGRASPDLAWTASPGQMAGAFLIALGAAVFAVSRVSLPVTRIVYIAFSYLGMTIGYVVGRILLAVIFYIVVTPIGLIRRALGKDSLDRDWEDARDSYWWDTERREDERFYERQF